MVAWEESETGTRSSVTAAAPVPSSSHPQALPSLAPVKAKRQELNCTFNIYWQAALFVSRLLFVSLGWWHSQDAAGGS